VRPDYAVAIGVEADKRCYTTHHTSPGSTTITIRGEVLGACGRLRDAAAVAVTGDRVDDPRPLNLVMPVVLSGAGELAAASRNTAAIAKTAR
jgi:hypothetical protein